MKRYKFKLSSLLKVREFKEKKIKIELGEIVKAMDGIRDDIKKINDDIDDAYSSQEKLAGEDVPASFIQFLPFFWGGKRDDLKMKDNLLHAYQKKYDELVKELTVAMGEVKVIEKIKEKDLAEYKKDSIREEVLNNEEMMMMRRNNKNKGI